MKWSAARTERDIKGENMVMWGQESCSGEHIYVEVDHEVREAWVHVLSGKVIRLGCDNNNGEAMMRLGWRICSSCSPLWSKTAENSRLSSVRWKEALEAGFPRPMKAQLWLENWSILIQPNLPFSPFLGCSVSILGIYLNKRIYAC